MKVCLPCNLQLPEQTHYCPMCGKPGREPGQPEEWSFKGIIAQWPAIVGALVAISICGWWIWFSTVGTKRARFKAAPERYGAVSESQKWWDLGYKSGEVIGRQYGQQRGGIPTAEALRKAGKDTRVGLGVTDARQADDFERGFSSGFRDAYKAATKPAF